MEYKTPSGKASSEFTVKRSRFIGQIKPVSSEEEALEFITEVKTAHRDAAHNVYAYVLRDGVRRSSDDGEPQGTAGPPVLDVLLKEGLTDCVLTVTRYFGGVLLGAGGLTRAYSRSARLTVNEVGAVIMERCVIVRFVCDYKFYNSLPALAATHNAAEEDVVFEENLTVRMSLPAENFEAFDEQLYQWSSGQIRSEIIGETFAPKK